MPEEEARRGTDDPEVATPGRALERLRAGERGTAQQAAARIGHAAVEVSGEVGYRKLTVALILERSVANRSGFYQRFADRHEAYAVGYAEGIDLLSARMLEAGRRAASWSGGLEAALDQLAAFAVDEPSYANGLLAQVHVAGKAALEKRKEVKERFSRAVDSARRQTQVSEHPPPQIAAEFVVGAVEQSVISALTRGVPEEFRATVPELVHLARSTYFGPEETEENG